MALWSFPLACAESTLIEYFAAKVLFGRVAWRNLFRCVCVANVASYIGLFGIVALFIHFRWY